MLRVVHKSAEVTWHGGDVRLAVVAAPPWPPCTPMDPVCKRLRTFKTCTEIVERTHAREQNAPDEADEREEMI